MVWRPKGARILRQQPPNLVLTPIRCLPAPLGDVVQQVRVPVNVGRGQDQPNSSGMAGVSANRLMPLTRLSTPRTKYRRSWSGYRLRMGAVMSPPKRSSLLRAEPQQAHGLGNCGAPPFHRRRQGAGPGFDRVGLPPVNGNERIPTFGSVELPRTGVPVSGQASLEEAIRS